MKKFSPFLLVLFAIFLMSRPAEATPSLSISAHPEQAVQGEPLSVTVIFSWPETAGVQLKEITPPQSETLEFLDHRAFSESSLSDGKVTLSRTFIYRYKVLKKGECTLSPARASYTTADAPDQKLEMTSESLTLRAVSKVYYYSRRSLLFFAATLPFFLVIGGQLWWIRKRKVNAKRKKDVADDRLERAALREMASARSVRVSGDLKKYYTTLKSVLSEYIRQKYPASAESLPEALRQLSGDCAREAERVCFGGYVPSKDEEEKFVRDLERYFKSAMPKQDPLDEIETVEK